jgi:translocator protein
MQKFFQLIVCVMISELAGIIGGLATASSVRTWYVNLVKPSFNPPSWVFGPVWTLLYALMGGALFLVWQKRTFSGARLAFIVFFVQLILNTLWSLIFFGLKNPGFAFFEIIFLWLAILATMILFYRVDPRTLWLLLPYLLWVSFASFLNYSIWRLN